MRIEEEIAQGEGEQLEFKLALSKDDTKWLKTVVAFANGRGGRILFGVDVDKTLVGVEEAIAVRDSIADAIANRCTPMVPVNIGILTLEGHHIIEVEVLQGNETPYYLKSQGDTEGVYIRYDATTRKADEYILRDLRISGAGKSYDCLECRGLPPVSESEIKKLCRNLRRVARNNAITDEQRKAVKPLTVTQLVKWGVLIDIKGKYYPTNAYALLTGNSPEPPVVKCGVFKGTDRAYFIDRREFNGPVQDQLEEAVKYALSKINMGARFEGAYRIDVYEIPPIVIRELVTNAIVHRNYINADASPVTVALYDDRLEVTSPGGLVRGMSYEKMFKGYSQCRNKALAEAFAYMNLMEDWGSGLKRCVRELKEAGIADIEVIVWANAVRVNVYRNSMNNTPNDLKKPAIAPQKPSFGVEKPSIDTEKPSFGVEKPSIAPKKPSFGGKKPSIDTEKPSFGGKKPAIAPQKPSFGGEKPSIDTEKPSFGGKKPAIAPKKPSFAPKKPSFDDFLNKVSRPTYDNVRKLFMEIPAGEIFGRLRVMEILGLSNGPAGDLIKTMKKNAVIVEVKGHGKGKYCFNPLNVKS